MVQTPKYVLRLSSKIPTIGILIFFLLFVYSSTLYPGGHTNDLNSEGFDWFNNYWCNLTNVRAMNGQLNPARPSSILAMIILCTSLGIFFVQFAEIYTKNKLWKHIIQIGGVLSMFFASLIFTTYHDIMIIISSFFGCFVIIGVIKDMYHSNLNRYKCSGLFCFFLLGLNNYIYYSNHYIEYLPFLQKITFLTVLLWIIGLNDHLENR